MNSNLYIGLISGTSMDAVDCALLDLQSERPVLVDFTVREIPAPLKRQILELCSDGPDQVHLLGKTDIELARLFADSALSLIRQNSLEPADVAAIGSHGQTIRHQPPGQTPPGSSGFSCQYTLQIGDPNTICELTGITTVADFRRKDLAAGGQGAPLVPAFHRHIFASPEADRVVLNIGGMSNITLLPRDSGTMPAFDTGPGNVLMDIWIRQIMEKEFDESGQWAATGNIIPELLNACLAEPYFSLPHPKSTGRELFNKLWLQRHLAGLDRQPEPADVQATLLELTAHSVAEAIIRLLPEGELIVCGGGARNTALMERLGSKLETFSVMDSARSGFDADCVEAAAFAWLAKQTLSRLSVDYTDITGAAHPNIMGGIYYSSGKTGSD